MISLGSAVNSGGNGGFIYEANARRSSLPREPRSSKPEGASSDSEFRELVKGQRHSNENLERGYYQYCCLLLVINGGA